MDKIPDDIIILILEICSPDALLSLRRVCSSLRAVVDLQLPRIATCSVQKHYQPRAPRIIVDCELSSYASACKWLRYITYRYLATILVEWYHTPRLIGSHHYNLYGPGYSSSDPAGDELRDRVANGWCVLARLSDIAVAIEGRRGLCHLPMLRNLRLLKPAFPKRIKQIIENPPHACGIAYKDAADLEMLLMMCRAAFSFFEPSTRQEPSVTCKHQLRGLHYSPDCIIHSYFTESSDSWRVLILGDWWFLQWQILILGPDVFLKQWDPIPTEDTRHYFADQLRRIVSGLDYKTAETHRKHARELQLLLKQKAVGPETKHLKQLPDYRAYFWYSLETTDNIDFTIRLP